MKPGAESNSMILVEKLRPMIFIKTANYQINSIEPVDLTPYGIKMDAHKISEEGLKIHTECSSQEVSFPSYFH